MASQRDRTPENAGPTPAGCLVSPHGPATPRNLPAPPRSGRQVQPKRSEMRLKTFCSAGAAARPPSGPAARRPEHPVAGAAARQQGAPQAPGAVPAVPARWPPRRRRRRQGGPPLSIYMLKNSGERGSPCRTPHVLSKAGPSWPPTLGRTRTLQYISQSVASMFPRNPTGSPGILGTTREPCRPWPECGRRPPPAAAHECDSLGDSAERCSRGERRCALEHSHSGTAVAGGGSSVTPGGARGAPPAWAAGRKPVGPG
jgi:hypothetical protein